MRRTLPGRSGVGSIRGVDVLVRSSWFLIAPPDRGADGSPTSRRSEPGLGPLKYLAGLAFAVLFYLSLLLHEDLARPNGAALRPGRAVDQPGVPRRGSPRSTPRARTPGQEFKVSVVGPLASIGVGLLFCARAVAGHAGRTARGCRPGGLMTHTWWWGCYNLIPGPAPSTADTCFKALVWKITGNMHRGTIVAAAGEVASPPSWSCSGRG